MNNELSYAKNFVEILENVRKVNWSELNAVIEMKKLGWSFKYNEGMVDKTPYYVRHEEDQMIFEKDNGYYKIKINTVSMGIVVEDIHDSQQYYTYPTIFLNMDEIKCIYDIFWYLKNCREITDVKGDLDKS